METSSQTDTFQPSKYPYRGHAATQIAKLQKGKLIRAKEFTHSVKK